MACLPDLSVSGADMFFLFLYFSLFCCCLLLYSLATADFFRVEFPLRNTRTIPRISLREPKSAQGAALDFGGMILLKL